MKKGASYPSYIRLHRSGELLRRARAAVEALRSCALCPRRCGADRLGDERGACGIGRFAVVASAGPHFGEEAPLVGTGGSGTIFFSGCNLSCVYCQNFDISQTVRGETARPARLAALMLALQAAGCHNINLVSPSHVAAEILEALPAAVEGGLRLPLVYNSGGYDSAGTLRLFDGVVDIYMPDAKYGGNEEGKIYSGVPDYADVNRAALAEMHRQVGPLTLDGHGIARRGLLIRHLVLPNDIARSEAVLRFIARSLSPDSYVNIMDQYRPCHHASSYPELSRRITSEEFRRVREIARSLGLQPTILSIPFINRIEKI